MTFSHLMDSIIHRDPENIKAGRYYGGYVIGKIELSPESTLRFLAAG